MATALFLLTGAVLFAVVVSPPSAARAANISVDQCNDVGPGPGGATTGMTCSVTIVNTINGGVTSSTVTTVRACSLDPCPSGNGTFTTSSDDLVTNITQCNDSANDAAHPNTCTVTVTNNISEDTPGAEPVTAATVNQCVGSGGGGGGTLNCDPFPATTTSATVTQCNGSGNGGGATVTCTVDSDSMVSAAIPITINQCNGTANPGGSLLTCLTSITTNITPAAVAPTGTPTDTPTDAPTDGPTDSPTDTPTSTPADGPPQVVRVPSGSVDSGGGSTAVERHTGLFGVGSGLLLAAAVCVLRLRRTARSRQG